MRWDRKITMTKQAMNRVDPGVKSSNLQNRELGCDLLLGMPHQDSQREHGEERLHCRYLRSDSSGNPALVPVSLSPY
jgi:hypothetical protein